MKIVQVRECALSLPEVTEEPHFDYSSFRIHGKIFVTVAPDEKHIHVFAGESEREAALALHAGFVEKLLWGGKVRGLRVLLSKAPPSVVIGLIRAAWMHKAPRGLAATLRNPSA